MREQVMWNDETGEPVSNPADLNRETEDRCDDCGKRAEGVLYHAAGATGRVCSVLFLCHACGGTKPGEYPR
jgi:hypothetical protein